jgi:FkbM family methyltransferase
MKYNKKSMRVKKNKNSKKRSIKRKSYYKKQKGGQISKAQLNQDIKVLEFYKNKRDGYFVDIGANDGVTISNTYLLEKDYGWKGICVEALPDKFNELVKNRTSININKAVYDTTGVILDFSSNDLLSGVTKNIDKHKNSLDKPVIKVETITLNDILEQNNAPHFIDYLTLDTEGSELIILNSVNFDKYKFGLIHLEHNYVEPRRTDMKNLLISKGYKYIGENQWDDEYSYEEK